jgi:hypothetical protein
MLLGTIETIREHEDITIKSIKKNLSKTCRETQWPVRKYQVVFVSVIEPQMDRTGRAEKYSKI